MWKTFKIYWALLGTKYEVTNFEDRGHRSNPNQMGVNPGAADKLANVIRVDFKERKAYKWVKRNKP